MRTKANMLIWSRQMYPSITRLDRAVEDILTKLKMPSLGSYSRLQPGVESIAQNTRENSREPIPETEHDIGTAPMGSLFEVTQLNTLRSRLKHGDPGRRSSKRKLEADLIAQGIITVEEAEEMFTLFVLFPSKLRDSNSQSLGTKPRYRDIYLMRQLPKIEP